MSHTDTESLIEEYESTLGSPRNLDNTLLPSLCSPLHNVPSIIPHPRYSFKDVVADFLVEETLFSVHRYFLDRESPNFPETTSRPDGAIELEGVTQLEFESLLDLFYKGKPNEMSFPLDAWVSILSISTRYQMQAVRTLAIAEIGDFEPSIDPVRQVILARQYDVPQWLPVAYTALCKRDEPINVAEGDRLGMETTTMISRVREKLRDKFIKQHYGKKSYLTSEVEHTVNEIFWPRPSIPSPSPSPKPEPMDDDGSIRGDQKQGKEEAEWRLPVKGMKKKTSKK